MWTESLYTLKSLYYYDKNKVLNVQHQADFWRKQYIFWYEGSSISHSLQWRHSGKVAIILNTEKEETSTNDSIDSYSETDRTETMNDNSDTTLG